jgi:hypothetical protein
MNTINYFDRFKGFKTNEQSEDLIKGKISPGLVYLINNFEKLKNVLLKFDNEFYTIKNPYDFLDQKNIEIKYSISDIIFFIKQYQRDNENWQSSRIIGFYSSFLLSQLTVENRKNGVQTNLIFDGKEGEDKGRYNYLFIGLRNIDNMIIKNVSGHYCGFGIGSYGGSCNSVLINNIDGDLCGGWIGSFNGKCKKVILRNIRGYSCGNNIVAYCGDCGDILFNNIDGDFCGAGIAFRSGRCNNVTFKNNKGSSYGLKIAAENGHCKNVQYLNIEGVHTI